MNIISHKKNTLERESAAAVWTDLREALAGAAPPLLARVAARPSHQGAGGDSDPGPRDLQGEHAQLLAYPRQHGLLQVAQLAAPPRPLSLELLSGSQQLLSPPPHLIHLALELVDGVHLPLPAVPCGHLVLAAPPDVVTHLDLLGAQPGPGQQLIEAVHRGVDDVRHLEGELHLSGQDLVPAPGAGL